MSLLKKLKSHCKLPVKYGKLLYFAFRNNWRSILLFVFVYSIFCYLFGFLVTFILFFCFFLYNLYELCDQLLYNPECPKDSRTIVLTPSRYGINSFETHFITTEDNVQIHVMLLKRPSLEESTSSPTLIYFHGNAGNIGHRVINAIELFNKIRCNVLLVEYRGYGFSKGKPSEAGLYKDAYAALEFLHNRNDICKSKIILFGRSLGGAVAVGVAYLLSTSSKLKNLKVAALIVENTFTNIPDISRLLCGGNSKTCFARTFRLIPNWFYKNRYESYQKLSKINLPTLFLSGLADELIPPDMMTRMFNCSSANYKELHKFETGSHNFTWKCAQYYTTIDNFLSTIFRSNDFSDQQTHLERSFVTVDHQSLNEKSPLIANDELESNSMPPNSVVMYHPQDIKSLAEKGLANLNYGEVNSQILQMLDSGINPILITIDEENYNDLVDI